MKREGYSVESRGKQHSEMSLDAQQVLNDPVSHPISRTEQRDASQSSLFLPGDPIDKIDPRHEKS